MDVTTQGDFLMDHEVDTTKTTANLNVDSHKAWTKLEAKYDSTS